MKGLQNHYQYDNANIERTFDRRGNEILTNQIHPVSSTDFERPRHFNYSPQNLENGSQTLGNAAAIGSYYNQRRTFRENDVGTNQFHRVANIRPQRRYNPNRIPYLRGHSNSRNGDRTASKTKETYTPQNQYNFKNFKSTSTNQGHSSFSNSSDILNYEEKQIDPLREKADLLLQAIFNQKGVRSKLIFVEADKNPLVTITSTLDHFGIPLDVDLNDNGQYVLKIDREEVATGTFSNKQTAKNSLCSEALETLRKDCFYIIKKRVYQDVATPQQNSTQSPENQLTGSKAHQMMLKMGWGGKGLGVNEQGSSKTVAESLEQINISKLGLEVKSRALILNQINTVLEEFAKSSKVAILRFEPDFSVDERAHIHKMARKINLKSKSEGHGSERRITITKKVSRQQLVLDLLLNTSDTSLYELQVPENFKYLWG